MLETLRNKFPDVGDFLIGQFSKFIDTASQNLLWAILVALLGFLAVFGRRIYRSTAKSISQILEKEVTTKPAAGLIGRHQTDFWILNFFSEPNSSPKLQDVVLNSIALKHPDAEGDSIEAELRQLDSPLGDKWSAQLAKSKSEIEFDGTVFRTLRMEIQRKEVANREFNILEYDLAPIKYSVQHARIATVRKIDSGILSEIEQTFIRRSNAHQPLAGALAVNVLVITANGNLLFSRRGMRNSAAAGKLTCGIDEMLNPQDCTDQRIYLQVVIARALREELGIRSPSDNHLKIENILPRISHVVTRVLRQSTFDFGIGVAIDCRQFDKLRTRGILEPAEYEWLQEAFSETNISAVVAAGGNDDPIEIEEVRFLPLNPDSIGSEFRKSANEYDSSAIMMAAVALHTVDGKSLARISKAFS